MVYFHNQAVPSMERQLSNKKEVKIRKQWKIKNHRNKRERKHSRQDKKSQKWYRFQNINKNKKIRSKNKKQAVILKNSLIKGDHSRNDDEVVVIMKQHRCQEMYCRIMAKMGSLSCVCSYCQL